MPNAEVSNISRSPERPSSSTQIAVELIKTVGELSSKVEGGVTALRETVARLEDDLKTAAREEAARDQRLEDAISSQGVLMREQLDLTKRLVELREKQADREEAAEAHEVALRKTREDAAIEEANIKLETARALAALELEHAKAENDAKIAAIKTNAEARSKIILGLVALALAAFVALAAYFRF